MSRFIATLRLDMTVQIRNRLYVLSVVAAALVGAALAKLTHPDQLFAAVPVASLLLVGGTTALFVAGLIVFEREEGTLSATIVSPLPLEAYLGSKVLSLSLLSLLEGGVVVAVTLAIHAYVGEALLPNVPLLLLGFSTIAVAHVLLGLAIIVRFESVTDFLVPGGLALTLAQLPIFYFLGLSTHWAWLLVPTTAHGMLIQGAFTHLEPWQWAYALLYCAVQIALLALWARSAFVRHVIMKAG